MAARLFFQLERNCATLLAENFIHEEPLALFNASPDCGFGSARLNPQAAVAVKEDRATRIPSGATLKYLVPSPG